MVRLMLTGILGSAIYNLSRYPICAISPDAAAVPFMISNVPEAGYQSSGVDEAKRRLNFHFDRPPTVRGATH